MTATGAESKFGKCRGCGEEYALNADGKVRRHQNPKLPHTPEPCTGSKTLPRRGTVTTVRPAKRRKPVTGRAL